MSEISRAVERRQDRQEVAKPTVTGLLSSMGKELQRAVPRHMDGDRVARIALTLIRQSDLAKATGQASTSLSECEPQSFAASLMTSSALGLEPGVGGQSYLVPYRNNSARIVECQLIVGYRGLTKLTWQHPTVKMIGSGVVYQGDEFDYSDDVFDVSLHHRPKLDRDADAKVLRYYAYASTRSGGRKIVVMTPDEVKEFRRGKVGPSGRGMIDPARWMERKVPVKQVLKEMPYSVTDWAHQVDEAMGSELRMTDAANSINDTVPPEQTPDRPMITEKIDEKTGEVTPETLQGPAFPEGGTDAPPKGDDPWGDRS